MSFRSFESESSMEQPTNSHLFDVGPPSPRVLSRNNLKLSQSGGGDLGTYGSRSYSRAERWTKSDQLNHFAFLMPLLLDLPPEVISVIVEYIAPCSQTLDNLCLAGNHNLLALVRPFTWREINTTLDDAGTDDKRKSSHRLAARFEVFFGDPDKASIVRSLNVTLVGLFDNTTPAILSLVKNVDKLIHVTHASISCVDSEVWAPSPNLFVKWVVLGLPSLLSLKVDLCPESGDPDDDFWDMAEHPVPSLRHVATRFCDTGLSTLWMYFI
ncbi:hypothetical protein C8R44DRAFT_367887 [Mycena epipterygia]|nr:hypothetical protein C8R44DRAFT_367887 [Mycena epipterygia]